MKMMIDPLMTPRKQTRRAILLMMGLVIEATVPFIIGGDMNMTPQDLADTGWVDSIRGRIIAPNKPTCRPTPSHEGRIIDFFVVSDWMAPWVLKRWPC